MVDPGYVAEQFEARYGSACRVFRAPGRVNLIGEHTDYNEGFVMPVAIDRDTVVAARRRDDQLVNVFSLNSGSGATIDLRQARSSSPGDWWAYVEGVVRVMRERGAVLGGADLLIESDIPEGAGLSSSAALELSVAVAFTGLYRLSIDKTELALLSQRAEHEYAGTLCGIMDQYISANGTAEHALLIDCRSLAFEAVPLQTGSAEWLVFDTGVKHSLASSEYNTRRRECEEAVLILQRHHPGVRALRDATLQMIDDSRVGLNDVLRRRARHVVSENTRTLEAVRALKSADIRRMGALMVESHRSLQTDYEVSCEELDFLVDHATASPSCFGARMTGGGFGGCTINLVERSGASQLISELSQHYEERFGIALKVLRIQIKGGAEEVHR